MTYKIGQKYTHANSIWTVIVVNKEEVALMDAYGSKVYIDLNSKDPLPKDFKEVV